MHRLQELEHSVSFKITWFLSRLYIRNKALLTAEKKIWEQNQSHGIFRARGSKGKELNSGLFWQQMASFYKCFLPNAGQLSVLADTPTRLGIKTGRRERGQKEGWR